MTAAFRVRIAERIGHAFRLVAVSSAPSSPAAEPLWDDPRAIVKSCPGCKRRFTRAQWEALPLDGVMLDDGLELRTCSAPCFSTMAVRVPTVLRWPADYEVGGLMGPGEDR